jgi:hypothetical protein
MIMVADQNGDLLSVGTGKFIRGGVKLGRDTLGELGTTF